jgi:hypothetical protein
VCVMGFSEIGSLELFAWADLPEPLPSASSSKDCRHKSQHLAGLIFFITYLTSSVGNHLDNNYLKDQEKPLIISFFFFLEPHLQSILLWLLWRWGDGSCLPWLALNCNPPNVSLPSS